MTFKKLFVVMTVAVAAFATACGGGRDNPDSGTGGGAGGGACVGCGGGGGGSGGGDGGTGGGTGGGSGGGVGNDGGTVDFQVSQLRSSAQFGQKVRLNDVVVTAVGGLSRGNLGDYAADMWVSDVTDLTTGIYVNKFFTDPAFFMDGGTYVSATGGPWAPQPGDIITVEGVFSRYRPFVDRRGSRLGVSSGFDTISPQPSGTKARFYVSDTKIAAPLPTAVGFGFGDAQNGAVQANREAAGTYVKIDGPLTISNAFSPAIGRYRVINGVPTLQGYNGWESTGGVLVNNFYTFGTRDAGEGLTDTGCDYLKAAQDGGTVTFTSISGIWDTYTQSYCLDGGTASNCFRETNQALDGGYTYVLWPTRCSTDLPGTIQP